MIPPDSQALPSERTVAAAIMDGAMDKVSRPIRSTMAVTWLHKLFFVFLQDPSESERPVRRQVSAPSTASTVVDMSRVVSRFKVAAEKLFYVLHDIWNHFIPRR